MAPEMIVLRGAESLERAANLIRAMQNAPSSLDGFGKVMVDIMALSNPSTEETAAISQPFLKQFHLPDNEDPGFDERIMFEALFYCAHRFRESWFEQGLSELNRADYKFHRWVNTDLVLERR